MKRILLLFLALTAAGCGDKAPVIQSRAATVSGTVTYEGKPLVLEKVEIEFENGKHLATKTDLDGRYKFDDVPPTRGRLIAHFSEESGHMYGRYLGKEIHPAPRDQLVEDFNFLRE